MQLFNLPKIRNISFVIVWASLFLPAEGKDLVNSKRVKPSLSFTDITQSAGTTGPTAPDEFGGHGVMFADIDQDERPDMYITMIFKKPMADLFFRNQGNNTFTEEAAMRGIADYDGGTHGGCWADLDNDGDYDLVNGTTWDHPKYPNHNNIFRNDGNGYFQDITPNCMKNHCEATRGVICLDIDKNGYLDIFCVSGWKGSGDPPSERNEVYLNQGNFQFKPRLAGDLYSCPAGQGAIDTDFDGDGDIDVIACNRDGELNILRNDGKGNFSRIQPSSIGIRHRVYCGVSTGDIDSDGDLDMILVDDVTDGWNAGYLYLNNGNGTFTFLKEFSRVDGYMAGFADLDNDGDLDMIFAGNPECYLNDGRGNFTKGPSVPVKGINDPRAIAFADIDNDGDLDFALGVKRSRNWLLRNDYKGDNSWLKVRLISPQGQAGAFGAKVYIYPAGKMDGKLLAMREAKSNYGYLGQDDPVLHFGLGRHSAVDVLVQFPDGKKIIRRQVKANKTIIVDGGV